MSLCVLISDLLGKSLQVLTSSSVLLQKLRQLQRTEALQRRGGVLQDEEEDGEEEEVTMSKFLIHFNVYLYYLQCVNLDNLSEAHSWLLLFFFFFIVFEFHWFNFSPCLFPEFPVQVGGGIEAGGAGGDTAG